MKKLIAIILFLFLSSVAHAEFKPQIKGLDYYEPSGGTTLLSDNNTWTGTNDFTKPVTVVTGALTPALTIDVTTGVAVKSTSFKLSGSEVLYVGSVLSLPAIVAPAANSTLFSTDSGSMFVLLDGAGVLGGGVRLTLGGTIAAGSYLSCTSLTTNSAGTFICGTATYVTTADVGTVTGTMIANDTVALTTDTSGNYVATITTSALTGLSGSCSSEGCAGSLSLDFSGLISSNPALTAQTEVMGRNGIIFEGTTADTNELFLTVEDPTSDVTVTIPKRTGTLITTGDTGTVTGTMILDNTIALTTDTSGNYAAGDAEAGNALSGDSATAFFSTGTIELARGGTGASLVDPNEDRVLFWDDSAGAVDFLTLGNGFTISGTTVVATKFDPASFTQFFDDFTGNSATVGEYAWTSQASGTGATATNISGEANHPGIREASTGTTATGYAGWNNKVAGMACNGGDTIEMLVRFSAVTGIVWRGGLQDTTTNADNVDGYYFEFDPGTSANWRYVTANNSTRTKTSSSTAVSANTWYKLKIVVNSANTSVEYFVNGTSIGTQTTNIPTSARTIGVSGIIANDGVATTSVSWDWDYVYFYNDTLSR